MTEKLRPADADDLLSALSFALQHDGRKRFRQGDNLMANITAKHLVEHLAQAGFVVMKKPPMPAHQAPPYPIPGKPDC